MDHLELKSSHKIDPNMSKAASLAILIVSTTEIGNVTFRMLMDLDKPCYIEKNILSSRSSSFSIHN